MVGCTGGKGSEFNTFTNPVKERVIFVGVSTQNQKHYGHQNPPKPHPLLGKLTLREMMFFTIYHVQHHEVFDEKKFEIAARHKEQKR